MRSRGIVSPQKATQSMVSNMHDLRREGINVSLHTVHGHAGPQNAAFGNTLAHQTANESLEEKAAIDKDARQLLALKPGRKRKRTQQADLMQSLNESCPTALY